MAKRITPAVHWQRQDDPVRRIAIAGKPAIKADLKAVLRKMSELVPDAMLPYIKAGDWHGAIGTIDWNHLRQIMRAPFSTIGKTRQAGAELGARQINERHKQAGRKVTFRKMTLAGYRVSKDAGDEFAFDMFDADIQAQLRLAQDELIQDLEQGARDTIEQVVLNGVRQGLGPDEIMDDIRQVIGLTPRQAQAVMNYRDMLESLDSGALDRRLRNFLEDDSVQEAIASGEPLDQVMVDKLVDDYTDNYLDYRAETIAQTESTRAANLGLQDAYSQAIDNGVFSSDAVKQFWRIALDEKTCAVCRAIPDMNPNGVAIDDPFDSPNGPVDAPPDPHVNCFPADTEVRLSSDLLAVSSRWYDGNLVIIRTASGKCLTSTPNHPILTDRGFVRAQDLNEGSNVVCRAVSDRVFSLQDANHDDVPSTIKKIADAFAGTSEVLSVPVPMTSEDFHGDGMEGDVAVVWTNRLLESRSSIEAKANQIAEVSFIFRWFGPFRPLVSAGAQLVKGLLRTSNRIMRVLHDGGSFTTGHFGRSERLSFAGCPGSNAFTTQPPHDHRPAHPEMFGKCQNGLPGSEHRHHLSGGRDAFQLPRSFDRDAVGFQGIADPGLMYAELASHLLAGNSGRVECDAVIDVSLRKFSGHVFNLQTAAGWYEAEGMIVHNCRCSIEIVTDLGSLTAESADAEAA